MRFLHITGIYDCDTKGTIRQQYIFNQQETDALIHAKIIGDNDTITQIINKSGIANNEEESSSTSNILQNIPLQASIRESNLQLTKQSIRESIHPDTLIINTSNAIEELDKVTNTLSKRLREWYALYDPELEHAYKDHQTFIDAIISRTNERSDETMGGEFGQTDLDTVISEAKSIQDLNKQRENLLRYLELMMQQHTPNIKAVAGPTIGAKLLSMAGSLERLSRLPSSTVQLLGAETALFRHLRNKKARPPKHGIIFNHNLLQKAPRDMRGKVARTLADKISIAAKIDYFKGEFIGDKLYSQVEERARGK